VLVLVLGINMNSPIKVCEDVVPIQKDPRTLFKIHLLTEI